MYEVLPRTSNCPGFVYFHSRNKRGFVTGLPPSHKTWKKRFVFVEFPPDQFPFSNPEWADRVIKPERVHPEPTKDLEDACEKLLKGDPVTGKPYAHRGWVFRLPNPDGGASATHDAEDNRADSPDGHAEAVSPHPDMNFNRMSTIIEDDDDDVEVLHFNRSSTNNHPSPPQNPGVEGVSTARCFSFDDLIRDKQVKSPSAIHSSEGDRVDILQAQVESQSKEDGHSSSRTKGQKRKGSQKSSKGDKKKKAGVISEEVGQSLLEPKDQKRKVAELEDALAQGEETARSKEEAFHIEAAGWAARNHLEVARSILTALEETMDFCKTRYKEPEGKRMITEIGSYGFQCGQKDERSLLYARLQKRDPSFDPAKMKLPALYEEVPTPPFPLE
ncbi:unnamed protein product [Cuscuta campestris]|uniref:Uncharacterized protein n=1 Tax=Cuscuta campestris TaxID=132261 RepID=A0A484LP42_9ASTE|nr:unnamed protein product [Cuscuta campestris]